MTGSGSGHRGGHRSPDRGGRADTGDRVRVRSINIPWVRSQGHFQDVKGAQVMKSSHWVPSQFKGRRPLGARENRA